MESVSRASFISGPGERSGNPSKPVFSNDFKADPRAEIHTSSKVNDPKETLGNKENHKYEV
jgi:hypothetical protein